MPISSALKGWDSSGAYEWGKEFLLIVASRIYKPSKRSVDIAMCHTQNQRKSKILSYKKIKQGGGASYKLSDANIQRLERMGFDWSSQVYEEISFDGRIKDLQSFKEEHGHCNVKRSKSHRPNYQSLASWCNNVRLSYKKGHFINYLMPKSNVLRQ